MRSPNGLKNMTARHQQQDPYRRMSLQVILDAIQKIRKRQRKLSAEQQEELIRKEVRFLKYGIGGSKNHPPANAAIHHEMIGMDWLMDMEEEQILELVTKHHLPKSWRKAGLL